MGIIVGGADVAAEASHVGSEPDHVLLSHVSVASPTRSKPGSQAKFAVVSPSNVSDPSVGAVSSGHSTGDWNIEGGIQNIISLC